VKRFFFGKKNQKTFATWCPCPSGNPGGAAPKGKSLFASFSSEKEESFP
jgi:hypothetical protein